MPYIQIRVMIDYFVSDYSTTWQLPIGDWLDDILCPCRSSFLSKLEFIFWELNSSLLVSPHFGGQLVRFLIKHWVMLGVNKK